MLNIMNTAFTAIAPMILLIGLGYLLKQKGFLTKSFLKTGNQLVFDICLPAMLFVNIYDIENLRQMNLSLVVYCVGITFVLFGLGIVVAMLATKVSNRRGVLLQCCFRSNFAIIGLSLAGALGGAQAVANTSVVSAATITLFNILAVISLSMFMDKDRYDNSLKKVLVNIAKNPLIWGVLLGMFCVFVREVQQSVFGEVLFSIKTHLRFVYDVLSQLKALTTPLSLIVLGGQFEFSAMQGLRREIAVGTVMRTMVAPVIGIGLAIVLGNKYAFLQFGASIYPALIALFGSPVAVSSAIMAAAMDNDEQLAAQLVVWTSLVSILTVFAQICLLMYFGLL